MLLIPTHEPLLKQEKSVTRNIKVWPKGAVSVLQDCFDQTDWNMFKDAAHVEVVQIYCRGICIICYWLHLQVCAWCDHKNDTAQEKALAECQKSVTLLKAWDATLKSVDKSVPGTTLPAALRELQASFGIKTDEIINKQDAVHGACNRAFNRT